MAFHSFETPAHARNVFTYDLNGNLVSQQTTTALAAPTIVAPPQNALLTANGTVRFSVAAAGGGPLSYQWRANATPLPGATQDTLTLVDLLLNEPSYPQIDVVVSNSAGNVTSTAVTILPDSNGNGLPDAWEQQHFGALTQTADSDTDGDGVTNREEWMDGTNPALNTSLRYSLTLAGYGGTVTRAPGALRYAAGSVLTLQTLSGVDNEFVGWFSNVGNSAANPVQLTMNANSTVLAFHTSRLVRSWGSNSYGQTYTPPDLGDSVQVAAGSAHGLVLRANGVVQGWGYNYDGQATIPISLFDVKAVAAGRNHSLAVKADGTVVAWGENRYGQCNVPAGLTHVVSVGAGYGHSVALRTDGSVICWGWGQYGQLASPQGPMLITQIAVGNNHTLALRADGTVIGWGSNGDGQLNIPTNLGQVVALAAGGAHSLALKADGTVVAWGWGGNGQTAVPAGLSQVVAITAGVYNSIALKADGTMVTWGSNSPTPTGVGSFAQVSAGESFTTAVTSIHPELPPQVVGTRHLLAMRNLPFHTRLAARNSPQSYAATNLPPGLTLQPTTGIISGTPTVAGDYDVSITGTNAAGQGEAFVRRITVTPVVPYIISGAHSIAAPGSAWSHALTLNVAATGFSSPSLPPGISLHPTTGLLSGTLSGPGIYQIDVTATTAHGDATQRVQLLGATPGGALPWFAQNVTSADGNGALQSGGIGHSQESFMETTVNGPGTLSFWWKVSSEANYDYLEFYVNGTLQSGRISGEAGWQQISRTLPTGAHTLRWRYMKDGGTVRGSDAGWVDGLTWTPEGGFASWNAFTPAQQADPLISGPMADPDRDGHVNLLEYAFNLNPLATTRLQDFCAAQMTPAGPASRLSMTMSLPDPLPADVTYVIQAGDALSAASWGTIATGTAAGGWTGPAQVTAGTPAAGYRLIEVQDTETKATKPRRFMRLQVQPAP